MKDILDYVTSDGIRATELINDDFFQAIKTLYNDKKFVSSTKLLLSAVDSLAYVVYGDVKDNVFIKWCNCYMDLNDINVSAEELWEFRNSILPMTNLESRKCRSGKVRRITMYVGGGKFNDVDDSISLNLKSLIDNINTAIIKMLNELNSGKIPCLEFYTRYLNIVGDSRLEIHHV